jgi:hypothetical protein
MRSYEQPIGDRIKIFFASSEYLTSKAMPPAKPCKNFVSGAFAACLHVFVSTQRPLHCFVVFALFNLKPRR